MSAAAKQSSSTRGIRRAFQFVLAAAVLAVGVVIAGLLFENKPTAGHTPSHAERAPLVDVAQVGPAPPALMISANGTVEAADSTQLRARVSGQVAFLKDKLAPGTRFAKGDVLARIDAADYKLALTRAQTDLGAARAALQTEQGQQAVAKRELNIVGKDVTAKERHLALRGPQLAQAKGKVRSAKASLQQAELDLKRTKVRAPYAGIVIARSASLGDVVSTADNLATIAATDAYWVDVSLPVNELRWLHAADDAAHGSSARIYYPAAWGDKAYLPAAVLRIQAALESKGRMARVLLRVPDPLGEQAPAGGRLLLGAYVQAKIRAKLPDDAVVIDAARLRENNHVWTVSPGGQLAIRTVDVAYRDSQRAIITAGLKAGDKIVTSELTAPVQGMPLRVDTPSAADNDHTKTAAGAAAGQEDLAVQNSKRRAGTPHHDNSPARWLEIDLARLGGPPSRRLADRKGHD